MQGALPNTQAPPTTRTVARPTPKLPLEDRFVKTASPSQIISSEKAEELRRKAEEAQQEPPLTALAAYVRKAWEAALTAKQASGVQEELVRCLNQRNGKYDREKLQKILQQKGSTIFMMLTSMKCRAAESWINDIMLPPGEKPWKIQPSAEVDLPDNVQAQIADQVTQEAAILMSEGGIDSVSVDQIRARLEEMKEEINRERMKKAQRGAERLSTHIEDQLQKGGYYQAIEQFISDFVTFPAAFLKGPVVKRKPQLTWAEGPNGDWKPTVEDKFIRTYARVSPFDMYPSPGAKSLQDGYLCERLRVRRSDLLQMIGTPGWSADAIRAVIDTYGERGLDDDALVGEYEREVAEGRSQAYNDPDKPLPGVLFSGPVRGKTLREWGMSDKEIPDPMMDYEVKVVMFGQYVVMARLNPHPLGHRGYYSCSFEGVNDSIWGKGVPQLIRDTQRICNAAARALVNNMGIASGPQVEVFLERLAPGEDTTSMWPWRIWKTKESRLTSGGGAVNFYQANLLADELMRVFEFFFKQASEQSGVPAYMYGNANMGGAGSTASGLSMLMNAASKTLKSVVYRIDTAITKPSILEHWLQVMLYDPIDKYGDIEVVARASEYLIMQEQLQVRQAEFLKDTNNPVDMAIIGEKGRAAVLRERAKGLKMPTEEIVPSKKEMEQREMQQQAMAQDMAQAGAASPQGGPVSTPRPAALNPAGGKVGQEQGRIMQ